MADAKIAALVYWVGCALMTIGWAWTGGVERLAIGAGASLVGFVLVRVLVAR